METEKKNDFLIKIIVLLSTILIGLISYIFYSENLQKKLTSEKRTCEYNGWAYTDGESFSASDGCNMCVCSNGDVVCTEMACIEDTN